MMKCILEIGVVTTLVSLLCNYDPIDYKITNFSLYLFVSFFLEISP